MVFIYQCLCHLIELYVVLSQHKIPEADRKTGEEIRARLPKTASLSVCDVFLLDF